MFKLGPEHEQPWFLLYRSLWRLPMGGLMGKRFVRVPFVRQKR
ncbi:MAG: hypothetical protein ACJ8BW_34465 [Ktedonobacteraceae bacterium]